MFDNFLLDFLENFRKFGNIREFWKLFLKFWKLLQIFGKFFQNFGKAFLNFLEDLVKEFFENIWDFWKLFGRFLKFWKSLDSFWNFFFLIFLRILAISPLILEIFFGSFSKVQKFLQISWKNFRNCWWFYEHFFVENIQSFE